MGGGRQGNLAECTYNFVNVTSNCCNLKPQTFLKLKNNKPFGPGHQQHKVKPILATRLTGMLELNIKMVHFLFVSSSSKTDPASLMQGLHAYRKTSV